MNLSKITLVLLCVWNIASLTRFEVFASQKKPDEKNISNFDSQVPLAGWRIRPHNGVKFSSTSCKELNQSKVLKINFSATEKQIKQALFFDFNLAQKDWGKYETLEFDLFCPKKPSRYKLTCSSANDKAVYMLVPPCKQGRLHCVLTLDKATYKGGDISKMSYLYFYHYTPAPEMILYIDNLKLVDYTAVRIEKIKNILEKFIVVAKSNKTSITKLLKQINLIQKNYSIKLNYKAWKANIDNLAKIRLEACQLLRKSLNNSSDLPETAGFIYDLSFTCQRTNSTYAFAPDNNEKEKKQKKEKFISETIKSFQESLATKEKIKKNFSNEDFAVGISNTPIVFSDYPQSFNGNFKKSIQLYAACREYEPFQIILMPKEKAMKSVAITVTDFIGPSVISKNNIKVAPMGWRRDSNSVFKAEMLRTDIKTFDIKNNYQQPVWVNIFVPEKTKPGNYFGEIKIAAEGMKSQKIKVKVKVWSFKLPKYASLKNAMGIVRQTGKQGRALSKMVSNHRINYSNIYEWKQIPLAEREEYFKMGTSMFNLLSYRKAKKHMFFEKTNDMYNEMKTKNPEFLKKCYVYGFDEVGLNVVPEMEKVFGEVKKRYGNIKTMCAINKPLWKFYPNIKNLDIWVLTLGLLNTEIKAKLKKAGREVWWYNLFAKNNNPFACRIQFWGTYKDKLDGVLFYNLKAGSVDKYQKTLYPTAKREKDGNFNLFGLVRENPKAYPISTIAFECWREGMEDYDYFTILENLKNKLEKQKKYPELVKKAEKLLKIPDSLTKGMMSGWTKNNKDGCLYEGCDSKADLKDLMNYRKKLGDTISEIYKHMKKK